MIKTISYPIDVINHTFDVFPVKYHSFEKTKDRILMCRKCHHLRIVPRKKNFGPNIAQTKQIKSMKLVYDQIFKSAKKI